MQKEPSFAVGDTVELLTGDHTLLCGWSCRISRMANEMCDRPVGDTVGLFDIYGVEYDMGEHTYNLINRGHHMVLNVPENDLRRV